MLELITLDPLGRPAEASILDVGCGYGRSAQIAKQMNLRIDYFGIDVVYEMLSCAASDKSLSASGQLACVDVLDLQDRPSFDYVLCNGIFTQKLSATAPEMNHYMKTVIRKMFTLSHRGMAFNVMTDRVNFMVDNLFYKNPLDCLSFCLEELSRSVRLDHAYPLYEYTVHVYRDRR